MRDRGATLLVADIGGTKTDIAVFQRRSESRTPEIMETYLNKDFGRPEDVFDRFFRRYPVHPEACCVAVAGPIVDGAVQMTNLPWAVRSRDLEREYAFEHCTLINDVQALAFLVPRLRPDDMLVLKRGEESARGAKAVIAPGTGLGHSFLTWTERGYQPQPSEAGHAPFAPGNALHDELLRFVRAEVGSVIVEDICSGIGIPRIYRFLVQRDKPGRGSASPALPPASLTTPEIVSRSLETPGCPVCRDAVRLFAEILVSETRNVALRLVASGGVYLAGSFALRLTEAIRAAFDSGAFEADDATGLLDKIPVYLIGEPYPVLWGAYWFALASTR